MTMSLSTPLITQNDVLMKNLFAFSNQRRKSHVMRPKKKLVSKMVKEMEREKN